MQRNFDVMAAGHLCLDVIPRIPDTGAGCVGEWLRPGKLVHIGEAAMGTGGSVSNTGLSLQRLGANVCFCARVGDDAFGRITMDLLREHGSPEGIQVIPKATSSYTLVLAPPRIDRMFLHHTGANDGFGPEDARPELLAQCRLFHFGYPTLLRQCYDKEGQGLLELFLRARKAGCVTSMDVTLPDPASESGRADWRGIFEKTLPHVDIFLPSAEEVLFMLRPREFLLRKEAALGAELIGQLSVPEIEELADELLDMGVKIVALKLGYRGFFLRTAGREALAGLRAADVSDEMAWANRALWAPALAIDKIASANGAGDSAIAGFLAAFLRGQGPETALQSAVCVGWQNLHALDAVSGIRSWEETEALCARHMPQLDSAVDAPGWAYSPGNRLWVGPQDQH